MVGACARIRSTNTAPSTLVIVTGPRVPARQIRESAYMDRTGTAPCPQESRGGDFSMVITITKVEDIEATARHVDDTGLA